MLEIRHVLYPTDFSKEAELALKYAVGFAKEFDAELTLFHVVVPYMGETADPMEHLPGDRKLDEILVELEEAARGRLDRHVESCVGREDLRIHRVVKRGFSASDQILEYAKTYSADLIVMGTHGRRGFNRFLLGSEAERVLRFASCPVFTLSKRAASVDLTDGRWGRIVVPIDFSPCSDVALTVGLDLAARHGAAVDVVHVFDEPVVPPFLMDHTGSYIATDPKMKDRCLESMAHKVAEHHPPDGVTVERHVLEGRIASTLQEFAETRGAQLIVMGTRGLSGLDYLLLGSTAAHMVRLATCPVLTMHADKPGDID